MQKTKHRVLLVEDNPADANLVEEALAEANLDCELCVMRNGQQVIEMIERLESGSAQEMPDLVLLDLNLPKVTGDVVLERVRSSPRCREARVFIISSSDVPADRELAMKLGAIGYFRKPSSLADFMEIGPRVRAILEGPPTEREGPNPL
jgi:two-component system, chemotaxis family, response regulator Rcp1